MLGLVPLALLAAALPRANADPVLLGPGAYLAFDNSLPGAGTAISPFSGLGFDYFHLETFEDHLLNVPGASFVASSGSGVTSVVFGPNIHDSVDADDGAIDGSGLRGDSFFTPNGGTGVRFNFDAGVLGSLPTHAGIVWTDGGGGGVTFQAFGPGGSLLGAIGPVSEPGVFPDGSVTGETAEDRFFGVTAAGGISAIFISSGGGGMEVDHLQYGFAPQATVPEPGAGALLASALICLGAFRMFRSRGRACHEPADVKPPLNKSPSE